MRLCRQRYLSHILPRSVTLGPLWTKFFYRNSYDIDSIVQIAGKHSILSAWMFPSQYSVLKRSCCGAAVIAKYVLNAVPAQVFEFESIHLLFFN